jgi:hypothetical protein
MMVKNQTKLLKLSSYISYIYKAINKNNYYKKHLVYLLFIKTKKWKVYS